MLRSRPHRDYRIDYAMIILHLLRSRLPRNRGGNRVLREDPFGLTVNVGVLQCPYRSEIAMWFWSPGQKMTLEDFSNTDGYTAEIVADIPSLEEATGITNEEFYQTFIQSDVEDCFETLFEVWP